MFSESRNNYVNYARGTLLLCLHASQFNKREFISDYISKAIEKLKKYKQKTSSDECLLANLNFFNIMERLYARKQTISKQMKDASFTIKAFKATKGNQITDDIDEESQVVVPTYGGINIEEDNKCANDLRDVLNIWERCFQKNIVSFHIFTLNLCCQNQKKNCNFCSCKRKQ